MSVLFPFHSIPSPCVSWEAPLRFFAQQRRRRGLCHPTQKKHASALLLQLLVHWFPVHPARETNAYTRSAVCNRRDPFILSSLSLLHFSISTLHYIIVNAPISRRFRSGPANADEMGCGRQDILLFALSVRGGSAASERETRSIPALFFSRAIHSFPISEGSFRC